MDQGSAIPSESEIQGVGFMYGAHVFIYIYTYVFLSYIHIYTDDVGVRLQDPIQNALRAVTLEQGPSTPSKGRRITALQNAVYLGPFRNIPGPLFCQTVLGGRGCPSVRRPATAEGRSGLPAFLHPRPWEPQLNSACSTFNHLNHDSGTPP